MQKVLSTKFTRVFFLSFLKRITIFLAIITFYFLLYFFFIKNSVADFGTIQQSYTFAENNVLATAFCSMINFLRNVIVPIAGISLSVVGIAAFQGKINPVVLVPLALGLAVIKNPGIFINILLPGMNFQFGCNCITTANIYVRQFSGVENSQYWQRLSINTGLDENCNQIQ